MSKSKEDNPCYQCITIDYYECKLNEQCKRYNKENLRKEKIRRLTNTINKVMEE